MDPVLKEFQEGKLGLFYKQYYAPLFAFAKYCLSEKWDLFAEDCVQNAIYKAWERKDSFQNLFAVRSFLYTAIKNESINIHKKQQAQENYLKQLVDEPLVEVDVVEVELMTALYQAIEDLPEVQKNILKLSTFEGLRNSEIAQNIGLSESSVKKYKNKAISNLKDKLDPSILYFIVLFM